MMTAAAVRDPRRAVRRPFLWCASKDQINGLSRGYTSTCTARFVIGSIAPENFLLFAPSHCDWKAVAFAQFRDGHLFVRRNHGILHEEEAKDLLGAAQRANRPAKLCMAPVRRRKEIFTSYRVSPTFSVYNPLEWGSRRQGDIHKNTNSNRRSIKVRHR
jgi:hypothetical protein